MSFPIKNGDSDFPKFFVCLPEGTDRACRLRPCSRQGKAIAPNDDLALALDGGLRLGSMGLGLGGSPFPMTDPAGAGILMLT